MDTKPKLIKKEKEEMPSMKISNPTHQPRDVFAPLYNKRIVIQEKGGVVITGTLNAFKSGFLHLQEVEIVGRNHRVNVDWIYVDRTAVAHFHHAAKETE
jgi:hypothetical protein